MSNNFITNNSGQKSLKARLNTLIGISEELKFLVGFFYFSGWKELFQSLKNNPGLKMKLLVGLQVDKMVGDLLVEHSHQEERLSDDDKFNKFMSSVSKALNTDEVDTEQFYNQVFFFLEMIDSERLIIKKTKNPNHAKIYLFKLNEHQATLQGMEGQFITGSSNLTNAGLSGQEEFNVEIKDYGFTDANKYFEDLWHDGIPVTEIRDRRQILIDYIVQKTHAAKVTPFEAYALILKTFIDLQQQKHIMPVVQELLLKNGFKEFAYQIDAVNQALGIINEYNGVVIADVVGLGKSIVAALIAKNLDRKTMIICPPGLIGNKHESTGWWEYVDSFELNCDVESRGKIDKIAESIDRKNIEVVIIDEAHYYRNQDTDDYEALLKICQDRIVILLSATPFNNSPADIFSLLKLFIVPGKSGITIDDDLEALFATYGSRFRKLSEIMKNHKSKSEKKRVKARRLYLELFGPGEINIRKVRSETQRLATQIKNVISPVVIRRNRLDLKNDYIYKKEVTELSNVANPEELFFTLTKEQSEFYDQVLTDYFGEDIGRFTGAIYQPFRYEAIIDEEVDLDELDNRALMQQANLYDFMRRLLVKRFESSFGAFEKSIDHFTQIHQLVKDFIKRTKGKYILDRKLMKSLMEEESIEKINEILSDYENKTLKKKTPKDNTVYDTNQFEQKERFFEDIESDIELFSEIKMKLVGLDFVNNDPKRDAVSEKILQIIKHKTKGEPKRKVIVFTEYVDTVKHLEPFFRDRFGDRLLICDGTINKTFHDALNSDFNAQHKGDKTDNYDVLITSDKLSEGFNLNMAGAIINYDIPWNPTRVIQRVGRINRIGAKVFETLYIYNFFPTEAGANHVLVREIASQKMFLIHNALGEDSKIFEPDEEPSPAGLFNKINENPEESEEENTLTHIRNKYFQIANDHPKVIEKIMKLPLRVKSAKKFDENNLCVLRRKGLSLFSHKATNLHEKKPKIAEMPIEDLMPFVECTHNEPYSALSPNFWKTYGQVKQFKSNISRARAANSLEAKAEANLKVALRLINQKEESLVEFMKTLLHDIRKYHTLSDRTLGRLGRVPITQKSSENELNAFLEKVQWLRNYFGADYLQKILKRVESQKNEVIIAVENIK